jgi:hypothetical protein
MPFAIVLGWCHPELRDECGALAATGRVVGVSVCCGSSERDPDGRGARAYAAAVRALLAYDLARE